MAKGKGGSCKHGIAKRTTRGTRKGSCLKYPRKKRKR
jgi:hypothetical protein